MVKSMLILISTPAVVTGKLNSRCSEGEVGHELMKRPWGKTEMRCVFSVLSRDAILDICYARRRTACLVLLCGEPFSILTMQQTPVYGDVECLSSSPHSKYLHSPRLPAKPSTEKQPVDKPSTDPSTNRKCSCFPGSDPCMF
jgi:hypothetical protein